MSVGATESEGIDAGEPGLFTTLQLQGACSDSEIESPSGTFMNAPNTL